MSVIITYFHDITDPATNGAEVLEWLQNNATEYFSGFELTNNNHILCKLLDGSTEKTVLDIPLITGTTDDTNGSIQSFLMDSGEFFKSSNGGLDACIARACVTTNGIAFRFVSEYDTTGNTGIASTVMFISKTDQDSTCIVTWSGESTGEYVWAPRIKMCDFVNSDKVTKIGEGLPYAFYIHSVRKALKTVSVTGKTTLAPICFDGGTYAPNLFFVPCTQIDLAAYQNFEEVDIDGTRYLYDGNIALKG